ncbi:MAG: Fic family protein [Nitrospinae bacterium]|nr:Fic family protein [Nitrospinota bacterium]
MSQTVKSRIRTLRKEYDRLKKGKASLLQMIAEAELPEGVYNSNAIENSTLTLKETEKILMELELSRNVNVREVFEAKNLARVAQYVEKKAMEAELMEEMMLLLHRMLIENINDRIAGRFRKKGEYVRVGTHIAPPPEHVGLMIETIMDEYSSDHENYFLEKTARFHLEFERVHPFVDGNGRIGRVIINFQLQRLGFPPVMIRDKEKQAYYRAFRDYEGNPERAAGMEHILALALMESLHKRIAYLRGKRIIALSDFGRKHKKSAPALFNAAKRQTIPAFREKGVWKIAEDGK